MARMTGIADEALIAVDTVMDRISGLADPTLRLGVTGLSRSGKTVFITALVHNLLHGGRLPLFEPQKSGRLRHAYLEPQPDDAVPRFQYEDHVAALIKDRVWPESTRAISEMRLTIDYDAGSFMGRLFSGGRLALDIVDYPGEWLLDLPLLSKDFEAFSREAIELARLPIRARLAEPFLSRLQTIDSQKEASESEARELAALFTDYLRACRTDELALSTLPPGRFLMPGDLEGSPALTFAPLLPAETGGGRNSLRAMMERRYEAYKTHVVRPFFREHITRLDRQIVLIDAMQAMNAGADAVADLERALTGILECFRQGRFNAVTGLFSRKIDRLLIAATKADHIHHESHERLEAIVRRLVDKASERARYHGADVGTLAMAAVRATREGLVEQSGQSLPVISGVPIAGETIGGEIFDGQTRTAIFPGDLPADPNSIFQKGQDGEPAHPIRFVRFRPPMLEKTAGGAALSLPHIRLDRALQFLIGDRLV
ncbi:YcjX family protein [Notoacmeibacter ruber]|uniref:YcjX family protein n=1 Tax=Notoacmeibacter ruber TaxID=2670375 RepID=A0A3L7JDN9_9HYPH|nr:YcjX family protein [Notoacmeibacter ruber]RLQ87701.1 YcjX family protein [Notoacmeibacter ruber]